MRTVFYTEAEIRSAYALWAPQVHEYAAACRRQFPVPSREAFSAAEREQHRILCATLAEFRDSPIQFPWPYMEIYHGSAITLRAANDVFGPNSDATVLLLSWERDKWFKEIFQGPDGWYGSCWVTVHDSVPRALADAVAECCPSPDDLFSYWVLTKARRGRALHEVWKWNGIIAAPVGVICEQCAEEGFIDNFDDLDHFGAI